jgi:DUF1680 family protein
MKDPAPASSFLGTRASKRSSQTGRRILMLVLLVSTASDSLKGADTPESAKTNAPPKGANLAVVATPSASYVSGDTKLTALNDGNEPRSSRDNRRGSYGNWNRTGTQWVQYDWTQPISTASMDVYWWSDGAGISLPKACRLKYWNGSEFVPVSNPSGLGVAGNQFNISTFDEVRTSKLRLEMDSDGDYSTGILEWRVFDSGKSPKFPPMVTAGIDRDVILGGKTYLSGKVKSLQSNAAGSSAKVTWTQATGSGKVTFEDPHKPVTTAKFSALGTYTLKLAADVEGLSSGDKLTVKVIAPPPKEQLDAVYTKTFKVNNPLWNSRIKSLIVNWIPHCIDYINRTNLSQGQGGIDNFIEAAKALAGQPHGRHKGYVFSNAWVHQTVEAMSIALMVDPQGDAEILKAQEKFRATLEDWIPKILAAQEPDGYLQTAYTLRDPERWPGRWTPQGRGNHEGYTAGYFLESAINHYLMTNKRDARMYDAAKKLANCWYDNLGPAPKKEWYDGHQEMEQALVRFGRFVNDMEGGGKGQKYIELARFLLDCRKNGSEYDQSHLPVIQQYEAVGHAVRAVYTYSGMADVAVETHDIDYQSAVMSLWDNLVNKKYYVTGGVGSGETSEGFGPNYSLRNNAYCESCSSCGEIFFQYKMNLAYQDAKYADLYEETLYNALLGSTDLEGETFYYTNPLVGGQRTSWHVCPCCVGNIPRTLLMLPTWMYARSKDAIYVNLFIGSTTTVDDIAGTDVQIVQATDYPWNGKVKLTINPAVSKKFTVHVRIPNRMTSDLYASTPEVKGLNSIALNGKTFKPTIKNGYVVLNRKWKAGDQIDFEVPMKVQTVKACDKIAADVGLVALRYGPLIYNVERADQPDINQPIDRHAAFTTEWRGDLLGGVTVIKGKFANGAALTAIPNYARNNRLGQMAPRESGSDSSVDYSGGTGTAGNASTNAPAGGAGSGRRNFRGNAASAVWMKDQQ